jgi:hypothetical protein
MTLADDYDYDTADYRDEVRKKLVTETEEEYWRDVKPVMIEASKQKRAQNREMSAKILTHVGISYESKNQGAHLILSAGDKVINFWPGTGLWVIRGSKKQHRGIRHLIAHVKKISP